MMSQIIKFFLVFVAICHSSNADILSDITSKLFLGMKTDYDAAAVMNSLSMIFGSTVKLLTGADDGPTIDKDVTFWCSNQQRQSKIQTFLNDADINSKIDVSKPLTFIIHGWTDNGNRTWIKNMTNNYYAFVDTNICVVDWNRLANYEYTLSARRNTKLVGAYVGQFINFLNGLGMSMDDITIVGHSLGGQISGYAGAATGGKLGQIFALDPAGPMFTHPIMYGTADRLDSSDAKYVQVIFTTQAMLGANIASGHENFYPNGGWYIQPGCLIPFLSYGFAPTPLTCSHLHATVLFSNSLNPNQVYTGTQCTGFVAYSLKTCAFKSKNRMGIYRTKGKTGSYYLNTSPFRPFNQL